MLVLLVPALSGALAWIWAELTMSVSACAYGSGVPARVNAGLLGLVLLGPAISAWDGIRARRQWRHVLLLGAVAGGASLLLVWLSFQIWWAGHACYA